ncbi:hypothetical protein CLV49_2191 [Labedella gwakjiensis]|uniref:Uncharacterized protein n=1 Tax=Labedella gwakjiensis TaxID=390269 RepID=A0A2P8GX67_9MICO|nr:hypothetical protein [Labedella gwakjiensis]PSL38566.1 hypothetical protein CLV49_2191 [Labedella gwakjiensis]RUQ86927.1 hypothetical protein ELQ93_08260 [Labedella gwakjiensis]
MRASRIRVFPEWGTSWPLWSDQIEGADPSDLNLSPDLEDDLRTWVKVWADNFDMDASSPSDYWPSASLGRGWIADGSGLVSRLRAELPDVAFEAVFFESGPDA